MTLKFFVFPAAAVCAVAIFAQDDKQNKVEGGFHTVNCVKVEPGKMREFRELLEGPSRKVTQSIVDAGEIGSMAVMRAVMPVGQDAPCDFIMVTHHRGLPVAPRTREQMEAIVKRAGIGMTLQELTDRRTALSRLISSEIWHSELSVGRPQKGDYMQVNRMKVHNEQEWMELERTVWKGMAEVFVKDGALRAWMVNRPVMPTGIDRPFHAVTVDVFPSWESVFRPWQIDDTFKKVHAQRNIQETFDRLGKSRDIARRDLYVLQDVITPGTQVSSR